MARFVEAFYPEMDRASHTAPHCDVVLCGGGTLAPAGRAGP